MANLKKGSEGDEVKVLQENLAKLGYEVQADGNFGAITEWAVKNFQAMFGYDIDGIVGAGTQKLIESQVGYGWNAKGEGAQTAALRAQKLKA